MKLKNKLIISCVIIILALIINTKVQAASASISASSKNVTVGTKVKITTTIKGASWQINLTGAVNKTYSDSTSDAENTTKIETVSFTPSKSGTYKVNLSGNVTGSSDSRATSVTGSVTITVKDKGSDNSNDNNSSLSNDATLKNLGITPNDFSGFKKAITVYNVSVPKSTDKIKIYADATNKKATVSGTGSKTLEMGKNTFDIKVVAEDNKTTKTYTLNITRKEISTDANLSNLGIRPKQYDFTGFKAGTTDYKVTVPNKAEKITIYASKSDVGATIEGIGEKNLKLGENKFQIKVTAEDKKTTKIYNLVITRNEEDSEEDTDFEPITSVMGVTNIKVEDYELTPKFTPEVYEYKVDVPDGTQKVNIKVETTEGIETEIVGNEELKDGENIITILVRDTKTDATTIYQIAANVDSTIQGNTEDITENKIDSSNVNNETNEKQNKTKMRDIIIAGIIILIVILLVIFLIQRHRIREEEYEDEEEYEYEEDDDDEISETKNFYNQMKDNDLYNDDYEIEEQRSRGRYKGKRFK